MKIIIAPAKRMQNEEKFIPAKAVPFYHEKSQFLLDVLKTKSKEEVKNILKCNDKIALDAMQHYQEIKFDVQGTCAIIAYDGIQYTTMHAQIFTQDEYDYLQKHLFILSAFYGPLRPYDSIYPYRLELNNALWLAGYKNLYAYWNDAYYRFITQGDHVILDLCSKQYSKALTPYLQKEDTYVKCYFMEEEAGKLKEKGVYVKMARGAMVRYVCEQRIEEIEKIKDFHELGYRFCRYRSDDKEYVFIRS